jgi:hypothetical protein
MRRVGLKGDQMDLSALQEHFGTGDPRIVHSDSTYFLEATEFSAFGDRHADLLIRANAILRLMNGAAMIEFNNHRAVEIDGTIHDPGGHQHAVVFAETANMRARVNAVIVTVDGQQARPSTPTGRAYLDASCADPVAEGVLRRLGGGDTSIVNLYRIWEDIRDSVGSKDKIIKNGLAIADEISRFTATANLPQILGDDSRHGGAPGGNPKLPPMTEAEAATFIRRLAADWMKTL